MMETCSIPIAFMLKQTVNLSQWNGDRTDRGWRKLLTWIADLASTKPGNANIPRALGAARPNPFREALGHLAPGDPIVDGALVNASTPAATAFRDGDKMPVMRILPKGAFLLGSPPTDPDHAAVEGPQKRIEIPVPFAIGVFPVLVSEYQAITGTLPSVAVLPPPSHGLLGIFKHAAAQPASSVPLSPSAPVTYVSYDDAQAFIGGINAAAGETYRMPSEAEWEYACRAGSQTRYSCGDTITGSQALFAAKAGPAAPGAYPPNAFGLYDMHGNVREWTADLWHESYDATPLDGSPAIEGQGSMRVVRGGGWCDIASMLRSASRMRATQSSRYSMIGFRVARTLS
jgi:formylglycine-generating enzyme required for sulfatase activity